MVLKLLHFFLATLVLLGSAGVTVNRHFCRGELKSVALFAEAEKCHKDQTRKQCPFHPAPKEEERKGCCDDEHELLQIDDQEQPVAEAWPMSTAKTLDLPPLLFRYLPPHPRPRHANRYEHYHPPPLIPDPLRRFQVFRI